MRNNWLSCILLICIMVLPSVCRSQEPSFNAKNPEQQYQFVKQLAQQGQYDLSRQYANQILDSIPGYHDVSLLVARTYLWQQKYDSAKVYIDKVLAADPSNTDALEAQFDRAYFLNDTSEIVKLAPQLINALPQRIDIREKYVLALMADDQQTLARAQADSILARNPGNAVALEIKNKKKEPVVIKNPLELNLGYSFDHFSLPYDRWWHLYTAGLRKPFDWGSLEGRINVGHLNASGSYNEKSTEFQLEGESYINLTSKMYMMLLYGYSPYDHFPTHKAAAEVWHKLPAGMIASVGMSYYYWDDNIFIGTASLEKYWNKYWFCLRMYAQFKEIGISDSYYLTARRYFNDIDYFQLTFGTGTAPDEPFDIKTDLQRLNATSLRCAGLKQISTRTRLRAGLGYAREEYVDGMYRNRFDGTISVIYLIGK